ncbi:MAG: hypothetical protein ACKVTZ_05840 [Bacteroidia bacterium]
MKKIKYISLFYILTNFCFEIQAQSAIVLDSGVLNLIKTVSQAQYKVPPSPLWGKGRSFDKASIIFINLLRKGIFVTPIPLKADSSMVDGLLVRMFTLQYSQDTFAYYPLFSVPIQRASSFQVLEAFVLTKDENQLEYDTITGKIFLPNEELMYEFVFYLGKDAGHRPSYLKSFKMRDINRDDVFHKILYGDKNLCQKNTIYRITWVSKVSENEWIADAYLVIP